jgi:hypothetical protein
MEKHGICSSPHCWAGHPPSTPPLLPRSAIVGLVGGAIVSELFGGNFPRKCRVYSLLGGSPAQLAFHPTAKGTPIAGEFPSVQLT